MQIVVELRFEVNPFKRQPHKMVKHTQIIRRQQPTNCFSDHFVGLELKRLKKIFLLPVPFINCQCGCRDPA